MPTPSHQSFPECPRAAPCLSRWHPFSASSGAVPVTHNLRGPQQASHHHPISPSDMQTRETTGWPPLQQVSESCSFDRGATRVESRKGSGGRAATRKSPPGAGSGFLDPTASKRSAGGSSQMRKSPCTGPMQEREMSTPHFRQQQAGGCHPCPRTHRTDNPPFPWVMHRRRHPASQRCVRHAACSPVLRTWLALHCSLFILWLSWFGS